MLSIVMKIPLVIMPPLHYTTYPSTFVKIWKFSSLLVFSKLEIMSKI
jgi:hypothetical protein